MLNTLNSPSREIYEVGEFIFREGSEGDTAYLIEEGVIEIIMTIDGQDKTINLIGKGELFGEVALIDHQPRTATARVQERVVLITIQRELVNELISKTDPVVSHLLMIVLERYRSKHGASLPQSFAQRMEQAEAFKRRKVIQEAAAHKITMANDIRSALYGEGFELHYQPICILTTGEVAGYEALIRWNHPTRGLLMPFDFLGVAEQTGQIRDIGLWTLERACRDWPQLSRTTRFPAPFVSVNMSPSQLTGDSLINEIKSIMNRHDMPPAELKLELTETVIINNPDIALHLLTQLTDLGSSIAIDDFGTGHSSLETLNRYPISTLKVDISFTRTMRASAQSREIVSSTIQLAHSLGMNVVVEGIEEESVRRSLIEFSCDYGQGWLFGKPTALKNIRAKF